jgi:hypothetical protein
VRRFESCWGRLFLDNREGSPLAGPIDVSGPALLEKQCAMTESPPAAAPDAAWVPADRRWLVLDKRCRACP